MVASQTNGLTQHDERKQRTKTRPNDGNRAALMGLPTTTFDLQFFKGLQTKTDPKLQLQGELLECENAVFDRLGRLDKRPGFATFPTTITNGAHLSDSSVYYPRTIHTFKDQLLAMSRSSLYTYADGIDQWSTVGSVKSTRVNEREVHQDNFQQLNPSVAYANGLEFHVFESSQPNAGASYGSCFKIIDSTGAVVIPTTTIGATVTKPKVFVCGAYFVVVFQDTSANRIAWLAMPVSTPASSFSLGGDITLNALNTYYDASMGVNNLYIAYVVSAGGIKYKRLSTSLVLSSEQTHDATARTWQCMSTWTDTQDRIFIADCYADGASHHIVRVASYSAAGSTSFAATNVFQVADSPGIYRIAGCNGGVSNGFGSIVFCEQNAASTRNVLTYYNFITNGGSPQNAAASPVVFIRSLGLAGKPWIDSLSEYYVPMAHESELQTTYFVLNNSRVMVARFLAGKAGGLETDRFCNHVCTKSANTFLLPVTVKSAVHSETDVFFSLLGAGVVELELDPSQGAQVAELGDNLVISAGMVHCYDGSQVFEQSFHLYPEGATGVASNGAGLLTVSSTYRYKFIYSHMDTNGNLHRSTTSTALTVTTGGTDDTITLTIPTLRVTTRSGVTIDVYRTTAGGSVYYRVTGIADLVYNDTSADTVTYIDEYADTEITGNEPLYTAGGELDNSPPCASQLACTFKNRVWLSDNEQPNTVWFSKLNGINEPVNFSDLQTMRIPSVGGQIQDLIPFGEMLVIAKETALQAVTGEGPNNTGGPGTSNETQYTTAQTLTRDVGVKYPGVWCETPQGVMFVSNKGIQLLDRAGSVQNIGSSVQAYDGYTYVAAVTVPDRNRAIFFTDHASGVALAYDWFVGQWSTFTNASLFPSMRDAVVWNNSVMMLTGTGSIYQSDGSVYTDNSSAVSLMAGTGWYSPNGPQGYVYLHKISVLCDYYAAHGLTVDVFYDYDDLKKRTLQIDPSAVVAATGDSKRYQFDLRINKKCMAFRVRIRSNSDTGQAIGFNSIRAEVANLPGINRLPAVHKR